MQSIRALIKMQILSLFSNLFNAGRGGKKRGAAFKVLVALLAVYVVGALTSMIGLLFAGIRMAFASFGYEWLYWSFAGVVSVAMSFVFTVYIADTQLFNAKDNGLLMSMPIKPRHILLSRMFSLYLVELLFTLMVIGPVTVVYFVGNPFSIRVLVFCLMGAVLLPTLALALATAFGWLIGLISSKLKRKNLISIILMSALFVGFMFFYMNMYAYLNKISANTTAIGDVFQKILPLYHFGIAIETGNIISLIVFLLCCITPALLVYFVLSKNFVKIATTNRGIVQIKYVEKPLKVSGLRVALIKKEFALFSSMPYYMFNYSIGLVLLLIYSGAILLRGQNILNGIFAEFSTAGIDLSAIINAFLAPFSAAVICFCTVMNLPSCVALSLEGDNIWIMRSGPIGFWDVFFSKAGFNFLLGLPFILIAVFSNTVTFSLPMLQALAVLLTALSVQMFTAVWGFTTNIWFPRFTWTNPTQIIKQSASGLIGVFGAMVFIMIPVAAFLVLGTLMSPTLLLYLSAAFYLFLSGILLIYLASGGKKVYENINA